MPPGGEFANVPKPAPDEPNNPLPEGGLFPNPGLAGGVPNALFPPPPNADPPNPADGEVDPPPNAPDPKADGGLTGDAAPKPPPAENAPPLCPEKGPLLEGVGFDILLPKAAGLDEPNNPCDAEFTACPEEFPPNGLSLAFSGSGCAPSPLNPPPDPNSPPLAGCSVIVEEPNNPPVGLVLDPNRPVELLFSSFEEPNNPPELLFSTGPLPNNPPPDDFSSDEPNSPPVEAAGVIPNNPPEADEVVVVEEPNSPCDLGASTGLVSPNADF